MKAYVHGVLVILLAFSNCGILGSDPKEPELEPGRRDYVWEVDTLYNGPSGWIYDIWGASPNDVWAVTTGGLHHIWHFDGKEWNPLENAPFGVEAIHGFSSDNIWAGGRNQIYYFNGSAWKLSYEYDAGVSESYITDIYGTSDKDVYSVGTYYETSSSPAKGFILHYNGEQWIEGATTSFNVQFLHVGETKNNMLILGYKLSSIGNDTTVIYEYINDGFKEVVSGTKNKSEEVSMNIINGEIYSYTQITISKFDGSTFKDFLNLSRVKDIIRVDGRHEKDLFIHSWDTTFHYNGTDIEPILEDLPRSVLRSVVFDKEVFFVIRDYNNGTNLIYHGTLPNEQEEGI